MGPRLRIPSDTTVASKSPSLKRYHAGALLPNMASFALAGLRADEAAGARAAAAEVSRKARRFMDVSFNMLCSLDRCLVGSGDDGAIIGVGYALALLAKGRAALNSARHQLDFTAYQGVVSGGKCRAGAGGRQRGRSSSGSLAMLAAIRLASSWVSSLPVAPRLVRVPSVKQQIMIRHRSVAAPRHAERGSDRRATSAIISARWDLGRHAEAQPQI